MAIPRFMARIAVCTGFSFPLLLATEQVLARDEPTFLESAETIPLTQSGARLYAPGSPQAEHSPLPIDPGPHLFIDDYLIAKTENLTRQVMTPERSPAIPNPLITGKEDGCFQPYMTVLRQPETNRFRIWYGHRTHDSNTGRSHVAIMSSDDGMHWQRPCQVLEDPAPIQFGVSVIDEGPGFLPAAERFRLAFWNDGGLQLAVSPDGLQWNMFRPGVMLRHNHDITSIYPDRLRNRYLATISVYRTGDAWTGQRRITMQSQSPDLMHWTTPRYVLTPHDGPDAGETQFYAMDGFLARGTLLIGMVKVLRDDLKADDPPDPPDAYGIGYTALAWSRDGSAWFRDRAPFFMPDPSPGAWDHAHAWIDEQVPVDREVFLYYGGYRRGHKVNRFEERQIGLVKIMRDRYVARSAGKETGRLVTPLLALNADALTLNADLQGGWMEVRLLDEHGIPLPGYALDGKKRITGDALDAPLQWQKPMREIAGRPLRIEFIFQQGRLFGFTTQKSGASS